MIKRIGGGKHRWKNGAPSTYSIEEPHPSLHDTQRPMPDPRMNIGRGSSMPPLRYITPITTSSIDKGMYSTARQGAPTDAQHNMPIAQNPIIKYSTE